jgi:hypothetical protein
MLFDKTCTVTRLTIAKDSLNRPVKEPTAIGTFPCTISTVSARKRGYSQGDPNATVESQFTLFGPASMDVKAGDLVEVDGIKYVSSVPYRPRYHHTEVEISVRKDA